MTRPALLLSLLLTACAAPRTMDVSVYTHGGEPFAMRDKGSCVIVTPREITYAALGAAVRKCFATEDK